MDDVDRRLGHPGEGERPSGRNGLDEARPGRGVEARFDIAAPKCSGHRGIEQDRVFAVDLEHPAVMGQDTQGFVQPLVGQPEVEDHERLGGRDPGIDRRRDLGHGLRRPAADRQAEAVVDGAVVLGGRPPFADPGPE